MSKTDVLQRAIELAKRNGWSNAPVFDEMLCQWYRSDGDGGFWPVATQSIIYNHDFARALWGDERIEHWEPTPAWQFHLQEMVIAPDPLTYLEAHLPVEDKK